MLNVESDSGGRHLIEKITTTLFYKGELRDVRNVRGGLMHSPLGRLDYRNELSHTMSFRGRLRHTPRYRKD